MTRVFVGLGSNLAHPRRQIARALRALERIPGTRLVAHSRNYLTAPIGSSEPQPDYVNAVAALDTTLAPRALLRHLQAIERRQGRRREPARRNAPRTLDLDLLLFGGRRMRTRDLVVPHPRMHERAFVLRPLAELVAAAAIPGRGNVRRLLRGVAGQRVARTRSQRR